eukprot:TRINITY_DN18751_c0_g1_i1.p1 TRINITY_DN18751_c0_g1~~TRINITY_DN18751_c0_g1_i1.p1  ORF type:complete len:466 (-),score=112.63 TRINITY_DN18751_c0_g1_i1:108-1505(-)
MRRSTARLLKLTSFFIFTGVLIYKSSNFPSGDEELSESSSAGGNESLVAKASKVSSSLSGERVHRLPNNTGNASGYGNYDSSEGNNNNPNNISEILRNIHEINAEEKILNLEKFGDDFESNSTVVIVVQVHDRVEYLKELIGSFSQAKGIQSVLLIFSHDVWNQEINTMVRSIEFARVMQIFYPLSIQTHPDEFPGSSPNDCPMNVKREKARDIKCTNSEWADIYGHYREPKFTQIKHHWWWKANKVFYHIEALKNYEGLVLFLEEDHYVSQDFLPVLKLMHSERSQVCPNCDIICLGTYLKTYNFQRNGHQVELTQWLSVKHNMGMAFTRELWRRIMGCRTFFCNYDDYNWDWSLQHVSLSCLSQKIYVMLMKSPRVFHIGECGIHHKKSNCEASNVVKKVNDILSKAKKYLFPRKLEVVSGGRNGKPPKIRKGNGGWGDLRDQKLCLDLSDREDPKKEESFFY